MDQKPSNLAVAIERTLFPSHRITDDKRLARAQQIECELDYQRHTEYREAMEAARNRPSFSNNILVSRKGDMSEFFSLNLSASEPDLPFSVQFKRYCVPGRVWTYGFQYQPSTRAGIGPRIAYGAETMTGGAMHKALTMIRRDLDRPGVVALFKEAFAAERIVLLYCHETIKLLDAIAPASKATKVVRALVKRTTKERAIRFRSEIKLDR